MNLPENQECKDIDLIQKNISMTKKSVYFVNLHYQCHNSI